MLLQNKQMLSALPPLATGERTFRIGGFVPVAAIAAIRGMVRFLRRHGCSQGQALTLGGVAETFVALNRGPRVQAMEIWSRGCC